MNVKYVNPILIALKETIENCTQLTLSKKQIERAIDFESEQPYVLYLPFQGVVKVIVAVYFNEEVIINLAKKMEEEVETEEFEEAKSAVEEIGNMIGASVVESFPETIEATSSKIYTALELKEKIKGRYLQILAVKIDSAIGSMELKIGIK